MTTDATIKFLDTVIRELRGIRDDLAACTAELEQREKARQAERDGAAADESSEEPRERMFRGFRTPRRHD